MTSIVVLVTADADDGYRVYEAVGKTKSFYSTVTADIMGRDYDGAEGLYDYRYDAFYRFAQVNVPAGATIISATLKLTSYGSNSNTTVKLKIVGDKETNPSAVSSYDDYTNRTKTTANVLDNNVPAWTSGTTYSYDITSIIAEIIAQSGWTANNAIQIFVMENGSTASDRRLRSAYDYHNSTTLCAELDITYTIGVPKKPIMSIIPLMRGMDLG